MEPEAGTLRRRLLLVDDHAIFCEAMRALFVDNPEFELAGEALTGAQGLEALDALRPDLVVLDLSLPDMEGTDLAREILAREPAARIVALTAYGDSAHLTAAFGAGVQGFVVKCSSNRVLLDALRSVAEGKAFVCPEMSRDVAALLARAESPAYPSGALGRLTPREREVRDLALRGLRNREIAEAMFVSVKTVEKHKSALLRKLGLSSSEDLRRLSRV